MIGASGAISGVLGAYLLLFPKAKVQVIIPIGFFLMRTIPAGWLLGIWIGFQVISGLSSDISGGGVAWWAHVGGFVAGMALVHLFKEKTARPVPDPRNPPIKETDLVDESVPIEQREAVRRGRSRIPDSRPAPRRPDEPPPLPDPPTVQRRRDP